MGITVRLGLPVASSSVPVPGMDGAGGMDGMDITTAATDTTAAMVITAETDIAAGTTVDTKARTAADMVPDITEEHPLRAPLTEPDIPVAT